MLPVIDSCDIRLIVAEAGGVLSVERSFGFERVWPENRRNKFQIVKKANFNIEFDIFSRDFTFRSLYKFKNFLKCET